MRLRSLFQTVNFPSTKYLEIYQLIQDRHKRCCYQRIIDYLFTLARGKLRDELELDSYEMSLTDFKLPLEKKNSDYGEWLATHLLFDRH